MRMPLTHPGQHLQRNEEGRGRQTNSYTKNFPPSSRAASRVLRGVRRHKKQSATVLLSCRNFRCLQLFGLETRLFERMTMNYFPALTPDMSASDSPPLSSTPCFETPVTNHLGRGAWSQKDGDLKGYGHLATWLSNASRPQGNAG
jgi:hypothetical protein